MSIGDNAVEIFAENFYRYQEALAPDFGCSGANGQDWKSLSSNRRKLFVAAARLAFSELSEEPRSFHGELFCDWSGGGTEGRECGC